MADESYPTVDPIEPDETAPPAPPTRQRIPRDPGDRPPSPRTRSRFGFWRIFWNVVFFFSVLANVGMFFLLIGLVFLVGGHGRGLYQTHVIEPGQRDTRIVVLALEGLIDEDQAEDFERQLAMIRDDTSVRAVILQIDSPGGTISASDRLYHDLLEFKRAAGIPVIGFMRSVAASGGYYVAMACDEIVAEPTTITGSIGVILSHFVVESLLEDKLGVVPVVVKSGQKKDWPSAYRVPSDEQLQYLEERLIQPAYERFLEVVAAGRDGKLTAEQIRPLADGGIFTADEAQRQGLIDRVGYREEVIDLARARGGAPHAEVIRFEPAFSLRGWLGAHSPVRGVTMPTRTDLLDWSQPRLMYLWRAY